MFQLGGAVSKPVQLKNITSGGVWRRSPLKEFFDFFLTYSYFDAFWIIFSTFPDPFDVEIELKNCEKKLKERIC